MKVNNKGFLLAETIVTVCIIATLGTSMYLYVSKTTSRYEERDNYENVVDVYKANTLKEYLEIKSYVNTSSSAIDNTVLSTLKDENNLNIKEAYLIVNKEDAKTELLNSIKNRLSSEPEVQALIDYLNWMSISGDDTDSRLIVWFNGSDGGNGSFVNLKIFK